MIKKTVVYFWSLRREFAKYFIVGISGFVFDLGSLILFTEVFGFWPTGAVVVNQIILLVYNFTLNKYWSFRNRAMPHKQVVRYLSLSFFNYLLAVASMYVFNHELGFDYRLVRILTIAIMVSWNFFLYKYWVYKELSSIPNSKTVNNLNELEIKN